MESILYENKYRLEKCVSDREVEGKRIARLVVDIFQQREEHQSGTPRPRATILLPASRGLKVGE